MTTDNVSEYKPTFSPDGPRIAFVRSNNLLYPYSTDESDIIVKDLVSGKEKNLTQGFDGLATSPLFSPDGEWIVFYAFDNRLHTNVFLVSLTQEINIQVTQGNEETSPSWRWVANQ